MKTWKLRLCKGAPCAALGAWLCWVTLILADPTQVAPHWSLVILSALTLGCAAALALLFWAVRYNDLKGRARRRFEPLRAVPDAAMPAAPVWPLVPVPQQARYNPGTYGGARPPVDRIEQELREITRDIDTTHHRPDDPRDLAS